MDAVGDLVFIGAEAEVRRGRYMDLPTIQKCRLPKAYRRPELDARIRRERTRQEAQLLIEAGSAGIPTPRLLDVHLGQSTLQLEPIEGDQLRIVLERGPPETLDLCRAFGKLVGRLHVAGIVHGDLTTSNVIRRADELVLIDFGLAQRSQELEDRGVDLHLVERTFESSHPGRPELLAAFRDGYAAELPEAAAVFGRMDDIKARGRYA